MSGAEAGGFEGGAWVKTCEGGFKGRIRWAERGRWGLAAVDKCRPGGT